MYKMCVRTYSQPYISFETLPAHYRWVLMRDDTLVAAFIDCDADKAQSICDKLNAVDVFARVLK